MLEFLQTDIAAQHGRPSPEAVTSDDIIRVMSTLAPLLQNLQGAKTPSVFPPFQFGAQPSSEKGKRNREDDDFSIDNGTKRVKVDILRQDNDDVLNFLTPDRQPTFNIPNFFPLNQNGKRDREGSGADMDSGIKRPRFNTTNFLSPIKREQEEDDNNHPSSASTVLRDAAELDLGDFDNGLSHRLSRLRP